MNPKWAVGMRRLAPGIYASDRAIFIHAAEICLALGYPPTLENMQAVAKEAESAAREVFGDTLTVVQHDGAKSKAASN